MARCWVVLSAGMSGLACGAATVVALVLSRGAASGPQAAKKNTDSINKKCCRFMIGVPLAFIHLEALGLGVWMVGCAQNIATAIIAAIGTDRPCQINCTFAAITAPS